ncbi:HD domain-containing protein [Clostridium niameyense]|uniref:HD domain-containing protein n=1 Tax=Clostridium niameyense TaxID=1622073 RepID=A0A6M0R956_9CLOT|nr:HD-GYP domain-containing protein [Clostridium niameyense]NEZ46781.1 HD domain-containing protein [Clostridium niameyense]
MEVGMDKILRAISTALDLAEMSSFDNKNVIENVTNINYSKHKFINHAQRTSYIALYIAKELNIEGRQLEELYVSSLLHDIGATNFLSQSHSSNKFILGHCKIGAQLTENFPIFYKMSTFILYHHENWDGSGSLGLKGDNIPLESQIIRISDLIELLYSEELPSYIQKNNIQTWIQKKENKIFSPSIVEAFLNVSSKDMFWFDMENPYYLNYTLNTITPIYSNKLNLDNFINIAYIFADIIDNKSEFTARHSKSIANLCYKVAKHLNYDEEKCLEIKIAGLLHDIGKLAIPKNILDKNGPLTKDEFSIIKSHPYYTNVILKRFADIGDMADWASNHHEKLNGKGYPLGLKSKDLSQECRIIAVCDVYQALIEDRPYRTPMTSKEAFSILDNMVLDGSLCEKSVEILKETLKI